jgi:phosphate transport system substrate-binding protein
MRTTRRLAAAILGSAVLTSAIAGTSLAQEAEGNVLISGSSTVEPISSAVAFFFNQQNPSWGYSVSGPGTTAGFEQFCNGETDISDASRQIKESEVENCDNGGVEPVELYIAIDGLAVITNASNDAIECLDFQDLYAIFGPESDDIRTWEEAQAFAAELGSTTEAWPEGDIAITAPGDESGTHDSFIEITLEDLAEERGADDKLRAPGSVYVASDRDELIIEGVGGFPTGIGFVGFSFAVNNPDLVRMVPIAGEDGTCVAPTVETVADGSYPIARPLFIYPDARRVDASSEVHNPGVAPFVDYYLSDEGISFVERVGYVPIPAEDLEATREAWNAAKAAKGS